MSSIKSVENFYKKYNNKRLADCGCEVSKEYRLYQNAFIINSQENPLIFSGWDELAQNKNVKH